jgi:predicted permease
VSCPPLSCHSGTFFVPEGRPPLKPGEQNPVVLYRPASPAYFKAMGVRLKAGRFLEPQDGRDLKHPVAIVNETFARTFWPGVDSPVGRRFRSTNDESPWVTVVGFVEDVKHYGLERPMRPGIYMPIGQDVRRTMTVALRTTAEPAAFTETARRVVRELDPELPLFRVRTMEQALQLSLAERSMYSWMLGVFAGVAFILALGGSYGVTSYLVSQRTRELGIRIALGAQGRDIVRTVLTGSLTVAAIGVLVGIAASFATGRFLEALLFGVPPHDPRILTAAGAFLLAVAALANWLPARRAARADPLLALRTE